MIVREYEKNECVDFTSFSKIWKEKRFYLIHAGCLERNERYVFMQALYDILLDFLSPTETFVAQAGAIYCLYFLYFTQPALFKKTGIRITIPTWENLQLLYELAFQYDSTDLIYVIHKLRSRGAFIHAAQRQRLSKELENDEGGLRARNEALLVRLEKNMNSSNLIPVGKLLKDINSLSASYLQSKADLVAVSLAARASEMVMDKLRAVKPADMNPLVAKPLPEFLRKYMEGAIDSIPHMNFRAAEQIQKKNAAESADLDATVLNAFDTSAQPIQPRQAVPLNFGQRATPIVPSNIEGSSVATAISTEQNDQNNRYRLESALSSTATGEIGSRHELPYVFPLSLLQASQGDFALRIEEIAKEYDKDRIARYRFADEGGLALNDYMFPDELLPDKRNTINYKRSKNRSKFRRHTKRRRMDTEQLNDQHASNDVQYQEAQEPLQIKYPELKPRPRPLAKLNLNLGAKTILRNVDDRWVLES
ncbi:Small nuclear RNA activating complex, polypeptide 1, 43kDa [Lobosporangium transversale]|nr:Small nuclear RNA activating complex, polypeptide 1, 43kDa [Lobosporangium transversale]